MSDLRDIMMEVRDRVIRIETQMERLPAIEAKVDRHEKEIIKAKASVGVMKWLAGIVGVSIPASAYAVYRIIKGIV